MRGEIGVGVSGRGGGSIGEIPVFERGENERRDNVMNTQDNNDFHATGAMGSSPIRLRVIHEHGSGKAVRTCPLALCSGAKGVDNPRT